MSDAGGLSSVRNALRVLEAFSWGEPLLGVSELARRLEVSKSSAHRLVTTLASEGFLAQASDGRYRLGIRLYELGTLVVTGLELREVAHPVLERLRNETNETVHLAVLDGVEVVYLERFESQATLRLFSRIGRRMPAHSTSSGKAILAWSPPDVVQQVVAAGLKRVAPRTIASRSGLAHALEQTRERGYSVSFEESEVGVSSVGAPIFGHDGDVIAAVSVAGPTQRVSESALPRLSSKVVRAAHAISREMGYRVAG